MVGKGISHRGEKGMVEFLAARVSSSTARISAVEPGNVAGNGGSWDGSLKLGPMARYLTSRLHVAKASPLLEQRPQWRPRIQTCSPQRATLHSDGSKSLLGALKLSGSYVWSGPHGSREAQGKALRFSDGN